MHLRDRGMLIFIGLLPFKCINSTKSGSEHIDPIMDNHGKLVTRLFDKERALVIN